MKLEHFESLPLVEIDSLFSHFSVDRRFKLAGEVEKMLVQNVTFSDLIPLKYAIFDLRVYTLLRGKGERSMSYNAFIVFI